MDTLKKAVRSLFLPAIPEIIQYRGSCINEPSMQHYLYSVFMMKGNTIHDIGFVSPKAEPIFIDNAVLALNLELAQISIRANQQVLLPSRDKFI